MATYFIIQPDAAATTYNISDGTYCELQYPGGISGIGIPAISRDLQKHPNIQGARDYGYRLEPREIILNLYSSVSTPSLADARRDAIYKIFRPFDAASILKVVRDDSSERRIAVHTTGMVDMPSSGRVGTDQAFSVRLIAPNPIWYDPTGALFTITPAATPWTANHTYAGGWEDYPIIKVYGAVTGFTMTTSITVGGVTTNYIMAISSISAGDWWEFNMRPGIKTVLNSSGVSQLGAISDSTREALFGMRIFPDPIEAGGLNAFSGSYSTKDANHKVDVTVFKRYLGI